MSETKITALFITGWVAAVAAIVFVGMTLFNADPPSKSEEPVLGDRTSSSELPAYRIYEFKARGHSYLMIGPLGAVHDPDCPCTKAITPLLEL